MQAAEADTRNMKPLMALVIIMGVLIVAGIVVVIVDDCQPDERRR